jgi:hypothetical protein
MKTRPDMEVCPECGAPIARLERPLLPEVRADGRVRTDLERVNPGFNSRLGRAMGLADIAVCDNDHETWRQA